MDQKEKPNQVTKYQIYNTLTKQNEGGFYSCRKRATNKAHKLDNYYGGCVCVVKNIVEGI